MTDFFKEINEAKEKYEHQYNTTPNCIIVGIDIYDDLEVEMMDRIILIKDGNLKTLGSIILGLKLVTTKDIKGFKVCRILL